MNKNKSLSEENIELNLKIQKISNVIFSRVNNICFYLISFMKNLLIFRKFHNVKFITKCFLKIFNNKIKLDLKSKHIGYIIKNIIEDTSDEIIEDNIEPNSGFYKHIKTVQDYYKKSISDEFHNDKGVLKIRKLIANIKPILVYPEAVTWEPQQRPQHLIREFANNGYICFFVDSSQKQLITEIQEGLYLINNEKTLLNALKSESILIYCSWFGQTPFINMIENKVLWYDILDRIEFFSHYDENAQKTHDILVKNADIVTYSAQLLKKYTNNRSDAVLIENGVNENDFITDNKVIPIDMKNILDKKHKIIGYYGAIEEWFDVDLINKAAKRFSNLEFVIIGQKNKKVKFNNLKNIHLLGKKKYGELKDYAKFFDVAIIPFLKTELTDCVSPVKFYEYTAMKKVVLSSNINEMKKYENYEWVHIYKDEDDFFKLLLSLNNIHYDNKEFLLKHSYEAYFKAIENALKDKCYYKLFARYDNNHHISVNTVTFYDFDGKNYYAGGAERYLVDLAEVCASMGVTLDIYQAGKYNWLRKYDNINVIGLSCADKYVDLVKLNYDYYDKNLFGIFTNIYSAFFQAYPKCLNNSIGISHGISWDGPDANIDTFITKIRPKLASINMLDKIVSVDTNTINSFQTLIYDKAKEMQYIPNYVDTKEFYPENSYKEDKEEIVILYPRRLYEPRGMYIVIDIIEDIINKYPNVVFWFVGRGFEKDTNHVKLLVEKYPKNIRWSELNPEEMPEAYRKSDISLIPTIYSEGTSLSCLEAMATGNIIISTRVGGLTDLIFDNFNGFLIEPNKDSLKHKLEYILDNFNDLDNIRKNALEVSKAFNKTLWINKWKKVIQDYIKTYKGEIQKQEVIVLKLENINEINKKIVRNFITNVLKNNDILYLYNENIDFEKESYYRLQFINNLEQIQYDKIILSKDLDNLEADAIITNI